MKLKFDANLPYQHEAVKAAVDVFEGQSAAQADFATAFQTFEPSCSTTFLTIRKWRLSIRHKAYSDGIGVGSRKLM
jgi:hypothetical protein